MGSYTYFLERVYHCKEESSLIFMQKGSVLTLYLMTKIILASRSFPFRLFPKRWSRFIRPLHHSPFHLQIPHDKTRYSFFRPENSEFFYCVLHIEITTNCGICIFERATKVMDMRAVYATFPAAKLFLRAIKVEFNITYVY